MRPLEFEYHLDRNSSSGDRPEPLLVIRNLTVDIVRENNHDSERTHIECEGLELWLAPPPAPPVEDTKCLLLRALRKWWNATKKGIKKGYIKFLGCITVITLIIALRYFVSRFIA